MPLNGYFDLTDLTPDQYAFFVEHIWNGVGSAEYPIKPPGFIFNTASMRHDFRYYLGGTEKDRYNADRQFLSEELEACAAENSGSVLKLWFYQSIANAYYLGLRALGWKAFEYYPAPAKNWEEFIQHYNSYVMRNAGATPYWRQVVNKLHGGLYRKWNQKIAEMRLQHIEDCINKEKCAAIEAVYADIHASLQQSLMTSSRPAGTNVIPFRKKLK